VPAVFPVDVYELEASPAQVGDDTLRTGKCRNYPVGTGFRFLLAREESRLETERRNLFEKLATIRCVAHGSGRNDVHALDLFQVKQHTKPGQGSQRRIHAFLGQVAGFRQISSELCRHFSL